MEQLLRSAAVHVSLETLILRRSETSVTTEPTNKLPHPKIILILNLYSLLPAK